MVIRSSNIKNGQLVKADDVFVNSEIATSTPVNIKDIIVVVRNGSRNLIGKHAQVNQKMPNTVIGAFMTGIRSDKNDFINSLFDSENFKREIHKNLGATINQITTGEFKKMVFYFPNKVEEDHIGEMFRIIDKIISLQQRKLDLLKKMKKGFLQNLFPKNGALVPNIKFKAFHDDWKLLRLGKYIIVQKEKNKNNLSYESFSISNTNGFISQNKQFSTGNTYSKANKTGNYIVSPGSFAFNPARINVGSIAYQNLNKPVIVSPIYGVFKTNKYLNSLFLASWFKTGNFKKQIHKLAEGSVRQSFSVNNMQETEIMLPILKAEQDDIASLFLNLNNRITFQQQKIDQLKQFKKFLLQNMFI